MGSSSSEDYIQLPKIDFSLLNNRKLLDSNRVYDSIKTQVLEALQKYGCFQASIDGITPELQKSVYGAAKHLFNLPLETKYKNVSNGTFIGYMGNSPLLPLYESMGIQDPHVAEKVVNFTNLMWPPQGNPQISNDIHLYVEKLWELTTMTRKIVFESLDLEKYLDEHNELASYVLKFNKYRVPEPNEANLGLHSHADPGIMTILHQNEVEGLEIQTKDDDEWLKVKLSPNTFIVMTGETINVWLNGRLHVPLHRVIMRENYMARYTLAFFELPRPGNLIIKAIDDMVDNEHPLLFKPFDYGEFVKLSVTGGQGIQKYAVKAYCGVSKRQGDGIDQSS
uniref:probable 2-oxoglutarate-dependent dioxygenase AOP1 n=1 Tax=Erigeron canadensis TaxID=72917 RepID=UPI001CB90F9D|nr:probable 2-oxoglutarate-dependent dioxygenase AOP1 [Erigeron canadensis]